MPEIFVDTNVFLDFYQSTTDRLAILQQLLDRADCFVFPEQTVREFRRNRARRLNKIADLVKGSSNFNVHTTAIVREMPVFKEWIKARDSVKQHAKTIENQLRSWAVDESSDPVYQQFVQLYCGGTTIATPADALEKAKQRKLLGDPPTSPDKHTVGDEIIWETLLACCDDDLIVVSRDKTFLENESILRSEYGAHGTRRLLVVTDSLSEALKLVGKPSTEITEAELEIQNENSANQSIWLFNDIASKTDHETWSRLAKRQQQISIALSEAMAIMHEQDPTRWELLSNSLRSGKINTEGILTTADAVKRFCDYLENY